MDVLCIELGIFCHIGYFALLLYLITVIRLFVYTNRFPLMVLPTLSIRRIHSELITYFVLFISYLRFMAGFWFIRNIGVFPLKHRADCDRWSIVRKPSRRDIKVGLTVSCHAGAGRRFNGLPQSVAAHILHLLQFRRARGVTNSYT